MTIFGRVRYLLEAHGTYIIFMVLVGNLAGFGNLANYGNLASNGNLYN